MFILIFTIVVGHRSQAPPEVRHVSGQHLKEFREFLCKYEDHFVVTEDGVYLKEYEGSITHKYSEDDQVRGHSPFPRLRLYVVEP
jgi:exonuclease 3'-5' domain-containing protein 1